WSSSGTVRSSSIGRRLSDEPPHAQRAALTGRRAFQSEDDHRRKRVCPLVFGGAVINVAVVDTDPRNTPARPLPHRFPDRGILPEGRYCTLASGISDVARGMITVALDRRSPFARLHHR